METLLKGVNQTSIRKEDKEKLILNLKNIAKDFK